MCHLRVICAMVLTVIGTASLSADQVPEIRNLRVRGLVEKLQDSDPAVRRSAAWELSQMRAEAEEAIAYLGKATGDADHAVRRAAVLALFRIGPEAMKQMPWMNKVGLRPIAPDLARETFDQVWETVDREYAMFVIRPDVDWSALRRQYRPEALKVQSDTELAVLLSDMLAQLRDLHVWVKVRGNNVPVHERNYPRNWNRNGQIYEKLVGEVHHVGRRMFWARTPDKIGWVVITGWSGAETPDDFDDVLEQMRDTRGLIVDARSNSGGDSLLARMVAGRFADAPRTYMHYQHRSGPRHTDLTDKIPQQVVPRGPWRYDRPVILLQGRKCMSANESFCAQMAVCPNVTTMGGPTRGSTGFPVWFTFAAGIEVGIPQWLAYQPTGEVFDERGIQPEVLFAYRQDAFSGEKDELLSAALERLRSEPLPPQPIAGPSVQQMRQRREAEKAYRPNIVSVSPRDGSRNVNSQAELRIVFDRPMRPSTVHLEWKAGGATDAGPIAYNEKTQEFIIPVTLQPGCKHHIVVNPVNDGAGGGGFQSVHGTSTISHEWTFSTVDSLSSDVTGPKEQTSASTAGAVVAEYNEARRAMQSFVETVRTFELSELRASGFTCLRAYSTTFSIQGPGQYLADVSDMCGTPMIVFREGYMNHISGYYRHEDATPETVFCRSEDITRQDVRLADPFDSAAQNAETVVEQLNLEYAGAVDLNGRHCHVVNSRADAASGRGEPARQWWIDTQSNLIVRWMSNEATVRTVNYITFDKINRTLPFMEMTPDVPYQLVVEHKKMAEPVADDEGRFIEISDGCQGRIHARWGKYGPEGRKESVGLN